MHKSLIAMIAAALLAGCVSTIEGAYDSRARSECEHETTARQRGDCLDRVDQNRRDHP